MDPMHSILIAAILHATAFRIYWVVALWKEEIGSASGAGFKLSPDIDCVPFCADRPKITKYRFYYLPCPEHLCKLSDSQSLTETT